jgi:hypothetical protein
VQKPSYKSKKAAGKIVQSCNSVMAVCMALFFGIYYFHDRRQRVEIYKNEFSFSQDKRH